MAVFAPSCLSHEVLTRPGWFNVSINNIKLGQSIYCWENSYKYDKCLMSTKTVNAIDPNIDTLQGDSPSNLDVKLEKRKRRKQKKKKRKEKKNKNKRRSKNDASRRKRKRNRRKSRQRRHQSGSCFHHLIDTCPLPQCNSSCPKYRNRFTGNEMDFLKMFIRYGIDKKEIAELLGKDPSVIEDMDDNMITGLIMDFVGGNS